MKKRELIQMLREARDLLEHDTHRHVRGADGTYAPCPACELEARIDVVLRD